jgi:hypothetical protein
MVDGWQKDYNSMYIFENYPKKVSNKFYEVARDEIVKYYSKNNDIISIYEYGSVSAPGVSDLDIMLILKDNINSTEKDLDFSNINNDVHSLVADGNVMKMPEQVFNRINDFDQLNLKNIFGKVLSVEYPSIDDEAILELISIIDWLPERILRLTRTLNNERINISNVLCILRSFSYSIQKINKLTDNYERSVEIIKTIELLRKDWHRLKSPEQLLVNCIKDSVSLGYDYMLKFKKYIESLNHFRGVSINYPDNLTLELFDNHYIKFVGESLYHDLENDANKNSNSSKVFVSIPDFFYPHFYCLSNQAGLLSSTMQDKIKPYISLGDGGLSNEYERVLIRKMNLAEKNAQFLKINNLKKGLVRYGFHFRY